MILAIDTATQYAGLALYDRTGLRAEETWHAGRNHTIELMPRIVRMLQVGRLDVSDLAAFAVALGPGSFTGLRIGLAIAKGLALPHKLPLIGIPTLDITAYPWRDSGVKVWAIAQAGRGRILAACYDRLDGQWQPLAEPRLTNFEDLAARIEDRVLCTGEIDERGAELLSEGAGQKARVVSPAARLRRAGYLAELAAGHLAAGQLDDPDTLAPIYPAPL
ncbi:MAG TPA: tRNA (adenosine(37)-N6)-threonylcarbamoyltransferase complex dimerization subunit type 1 TsaB [Anaerolineae bacterium]